YRFYHSDQHDHHHAAGVLTQEEVHDEGERGADTEGAEDLDIGLERRLVVLCRGLMFISHARLHVHKLKLTPNTEAGTGRSTQYRQSASKARCIQPAPNAEPRSAPAAP